MGVKELNKVLSNCTPEDPTKPHQVIIIDGSNLIFQALTSMSSKLKKSYENQIWKSIDCPFMDAFHFILNGAFNFVSDVIDDYIERVKEIYIVMDPNQTPRYLINTTMSFNHKYENMVLSETDIENKTSIDYNVKADEQELRKKRTSKTEDISNEIEHIRQLKNPPTNLSDEQIETIISIYKQSFCFLNNLEILKLSWSVLKKIDLHYHDRNVKIVDSEDEADLVIKNVAHTFSPDVDILVLSMDTDYNILFSDSPNVDTASLMNRDLIYNPHNCWKQILGDAFSYDVVIRLAPIFGNDYTVGEVLISAKNYVDALALLNIDNKFNTLKQSQRKKIYKYIMGIKQPEGLTTPEYLDDIIYKANKDYFKKYYLSTIIYGNWSWYNKYKIMDKQTDLKVEEEIHKTLKRLMLSLFDNYANDEKAVLYDAWNSSYLPSDWEGFLSNITKKEINTFEDLKDEFWECGKKYGDRNEGGEFV